MNDSDTITDDSKKRKQNKNTRKLKPDKKPNELPRWSINPCVRKEVDIPTYRTTVEIEQHLQNWCVKEQDCFHHRKFRESPSYFELKIHDPPCYSTNPQSIVILGSSGVIAKQSAVIAQKYQNSKVHD